MHMIGNLYWIYAADTGVNVILINKTGKWLSDNIYNHVSSSHPRPERVISPGNIPLTECTEKSTLT